MWCLYPSFHGRSVNPFVLLVSLEAHVVANLVYRDVGVHVFTNEYNLLRRKSVFSRGFNRCCAVSFAACEAAVISSKCKCQSLGLAARGKQREYWENVIKCLSESSEWLSYWCQGMRGVYLHLYTWVNFCLVRK